MRVRELLGLVLWGLEWAWWHRGRALSMQHGACYCERWMEDPARAMLEAVGAVNADTS